MSTPLPFLMKKRLTWSHHVRDYQESNLTYAEYERRTGVSGAQLQYWVKKFADEQCDQKTHDFVPVEVVRKPEVVSPLQESRNSTEILTTIRGPQGFEVSIYNMDALQLIANHIFR